MSRASSSSTASCVNPTSKLTLGQRPITRTKVPGSTPMASYLRIRGGSGVCR